MAGSLQLLGDLALIFAVAASTIALLGRVGLPSVVVLIGAGTLLGPGGLGLVDAPERIELLAELGVMALLFVVGTELSLPRLRELGRSALFGGALQVMLTVAAIAGLLVAGGVGVGRAVFWGYLGALSSTAIVLRALDDRAEAETPHGRFSLATLVFQDLCVVPMMLSLPMLVASHAPPGALLKTLGEALGVLGATLLLARTVVPRALGALAGSGRREVFLLAVVAMALLVAVGTSWLGLSLSLGGLCAGVLLADTPYVYQAQSELVPFRDALASLFFVSVGMLLEPAVVIAAPLAVLGWAAGLMAGKFLIVVLVGAALRLPARVALRSGFALAQVGELSFVLLRAGQAQGLAETGEASRFLAASVLTMMATPAMLALGARVVGWQALLQPLDRLFAARPEAEGAPQLRDHVIVAGLGLGGATLLRALELAEVPHVAIEVDLRKVRAERLAGRRVRYGDASSLEVLARAGHAARARTLVLLMSDSSAVRRAALAAKRRWPRLRVLARVHRSGPRDSELAALGVEVVSEEWETVLEVVERVVRRRRHAREDRRAVTRTGGEGAELPDVTLDPLVVRAGDRLAGRTIAGSELDSHSAAAIVALSRSARVHVDPPGNTELLPGDVVLLLGTHKEVGRARRWIRGEGE